MDKRLLKYHLECLDGLYQYFDEDVGLFYMDYNRPDAYHTKLTSGRVHQYVSNSDRAVALFDGGREKDIKTALKVVDAVLDGQCKKEGETFGLWPYFYEESLEEMDSPDWNMADFNGINLFQILLDYEELLGEERAKRVLKACHDACRCIINRDVTIMYTNVTVMDIYLTITFGERYNKEIFDFGKNKLKCFYHLVMNQKSFEEHNSPAYSIIVANIFGLMLQHIKDEECLFMINELNSLEWKVISEHYHFATGEWTGPQSRAYSQFLDPTRLSFFEKALNFEISLTDEKSFGLMDMRYDVKCPPEYADLFTDKNRITEKRQLLSRGFNYPWFEPPRLETIYISPEYTLSSFHLCGGWNQHRPIMSYFGNRKKKYCLRLRVLHDFYDFCSGYTATIQEKASALSVTNFHTNRGDTHNDLDKVKNATISAVDLRIRYQVEANVDGIIDDVGLEKSENGCTISLAGIPVRIGFDFAEFTGYLPHTEISKEGRFLNIDMVLYSGERRDINLKSLDSAVCVSHISIGNDEASPVKVKKEDEFIFAEMNSNGKTLSEKCIYTPCEFITSVSKTRQWIDGTELEKSGEKSL